MEGHNLVNLYKNSEETTEMFAVKLFDGKHFLRYNERKRVNMLV